MLTPVDVTNMSLRHIGFAPIVSFTDASPQGRIANTLWSSTLADFLASFNWSFATKWAAEIPQFANKEVWGYEYCHQLPHNFSRLISVKDFEYGEEFEITTVDNIKLLASNSSDISIRYICDDFELSNMSSPALNAFVFRLAAHYDQALNAGGNLSNLMSLYQEFISIAVRYEGTAHNKKALDRGHLNEVRNG